MNTWQKIAVGVLLFGTWVGFAIHGDTQVQPIVDGIKDALYGLGVYHIALTNPKDQP